MKASNPTKAQIRRYYEWKKTMGLDYRFEILSDKNLTIPKMKVNVIIKEYLKQCGFQLLNITYFSQLYTKLELNTFG